jgi:hypothetical protein
VLYDVLSSGAKAYLAVAYSRKGLHAQARRAIQNALELQPAEGEFRYLLGTILEREGDTDGAATAYRECLKRQPGHEQASARLELLGITPLRPDHAPAPQPPPPPEPAAASPLNRPAPAAGPVSGPRGTIQCPRCMEWSKPGLSCEWCAGPLVSRAPAAAPMPPPAYAAAPPYPGPPPVPMPPPGYPATYAGAPYPPGVPGGAPYFYRAPHRGGSILTLGILGLVFTLIGFGCGLIALAGLVCSILAWTMGNGDLAQMDSGVVDDMGRGSVQTGRILGIIGTVISFLLLLGWLIFLVSIASLAGA